MSISLENESTKMLPDSQLNKVVRKLSEKEVNMITKSIQQIASQYDRLFDLHFKYDKGTEKMWERVEKICCKILRNMTY